MNTDAIISIGVFVAACAFLVIWGFREKKREGRGSSK
jgi:hypothetical protein